MPYKNIERKIARGLERQETSPIIPCECGCGERIYSANPNGAPRRFKKGHSSRQPRTTVWKQKAYHRGAESHGWKGGEFRDKRGYIYCTISLEQAANWPTAHKAQSNSWRIRRSHRVWNEAHPTDVLQPGNVVHHINRIRDDDRLENLYRHSTQAHHLHEHPELQIKSPEHRAKLSSVRRDRFTIVRDAKGRIITSVPKDRILLEATGHFPMK